MALMSGLKEEGKPTLMRKNTQRMEALEGGQDDPGSPHATECATSVGFGSQTTGTARDTASKRETCSRTSHVSQDSIRWGAVHARYQAHVAEAAQHVEDALGELSQY